MADKKKVIREDSDGGIPHFNVDIPMPPMKPPADKEPKGTSSPPPPKDKKK